jgi:hypothetical protein
MIKPCSNPDCHTLTYGEICLGCLQRNARDQQQQPDCREAQPGDESQATPA